MSRVVCFGEVMLRLATPAGLRLSELPPLDATFGGSEANVAAGLVWLGDEAELVTALPEDVLGQGCSNFFQQLGVGLAFCRHEQGRLGIYFLERGSDTLPSQILYDRKASVFARTDFSTAPWEEILSSADAFHLSGINLALSEPARKASIASAKIAHALGVPVTFDCNYRPSLWNTEREAREAFREILPSVSLLLGSPRDAALIGNDLLPNGEGVRLWRWAFDSLLPYASSLQVLTGTVRSTTHAPSPTLGAMAATAGCVHEVEPQPLGLVLDRIGSGDAFAAGYLHGYLRDWDIDKALRFARDTAHKKHGIPGDQLRTRKAGETTGPGSSSVDIKR